MLDCFFNVIWTPFISPKPRWEYCCFPNNMCNPITKSALCLKFCSMSYAEMGPKIVKCPLTLPEIVCHSWNAKKIRISQVSLSDSCVEDWRPVLTLYSCTFNIYFCSCERGRKNRMKEQKKEGREGGGKEGKQVGAHYLVDLALTILRINWLSQLVKYMEWRKTLVV